MDATTTTPELPEPPFAVAFPGQGVDPVDLGRILAEHADHSLVRKLAAHLGHRSWAALDINDTRVAQPAVYAAGLLQALDRVTPAHPGAAFGHSMGELTAMAFAGVYGAEDGLDLVLRRADAGHQAQQARPGAMAVVMRLDDIQVEWVRRRLLARSAGVLELAVVNGPGQFVLSGDADLIDAAIEEVAALDGVARRLPIGGAYHSPLLADAVEPYARAIEGLTLHEPRVPVVSCTTQRPVGSSADVVDVLSRALVLPVRWVATMEAVRSLGVVRAVDAGPGATLANLARFSPILEFGSLSPPRAPRGR